MTTPRGSGGVGAGLAVGALAVAAVACCAAPALIAGGALAAIGGVVGNWWVIGAAVMAVSAALTYTVHRRSRRGDRGESSHCCPTPPPRPDTFADGPDPRITP